MVVVYHFSGGFLPELRPGGYTAFFSRSYLWVDFFFLLSGFVLAHSYADKFRDGLRPEELRHFVLARFARIYPLHLAILGGFVVLELVRPMLATTGAAELPVEPFTGSKS